MDRRPDRKSLPDNRSTREVRKRRTRSLSMGLLVGAFLLRPPATTTDSITLSKDVFPGHVAHAVTVDTSFLACWIGDRVGQLSVISRHSRWRQRGRIQSDLGKPTGLFDLYQDGHVPARQEREGRPHGARFLREFRCSADGRNIKIFIQNPKPDIARYCVAIGGALRQVLSLYKQPPIAIHMYLIPEGQGFKKVNRHFTCVALPLIWLHPSLTMIEEVWET